MESTLGAYQAKTHFSAILESVEKGAHFIITKHGLPVARLIPINRKDNSDMKLTIEKLKVFNKTNTLGLDWKKLRDEGRR